MPNDVLTPIQFRMLGGMDVLDARGVARGDLVARPKSLALFAFLTLESRDGPCSRDSILAVFWPDSSIAAARHTLRQALYELRQCLGPDVIETRGHTGVAVAPDRVSADALKFLDAIDDSRHEDAAALYRGDLLPGLHFTDASQEFETWLEGHRGSFRRRFSELSRDLSGAAARAGDHESALRWLHGALQHDPYNELALQHVMRLLHATGRTAEAVHAFREFEQRLAADLELSCSQETEQLAADLAAAARAGAERRDSRASEGTREGPAGLPVSPAIATTGPPPTSGAEPGSVRSWSSPVGGRLLLIASIILMFAAALGAGALLPASVGGDGSPSMVRAFWRAMGRGEAARAGGAGHLVVQPIGSSQQDPLAGVAMTAALTWLMSGRDGVAGASIGGDVVHDGDSWQVDVTLIRPEATVIGIAGRVPGDLLAAIEFVANGVATALRLPLDDRRAILPNSEGALRAHVRGEWLLERGEVHAAAEAFERAVALDPAFALGYHRLSVAAGLAFDVAAANRAEQMALALQRQLPEAEARIIEARRAYRMGAPEDAEALLGSVLAVHPEHPEALLNAAEVAFHFNPFRGRPLAEARPALELAAARPVGRAESLYHILQITLLTGDLDDFDHASAEMLAMAPAGFRSQQVRALRARVLGDTQEWIRERAGLAAARDLIVLSTAHNLAVYGADIAAALDVLEILTRPDREAGVRARAYAARADLLAASGRPALVAAELRRALGVDPLIGASRAAHLLTLNVLPPADTALQAIARTIVAGPDRTPRTTSNWIAVETGLDPWLDPHARALAAFALGDPEPAQVLRRDLVAAPVSHRSRRLLLADLGVRLGEVAARAQADDGALVLSWVTPEEAVISPLFSRPLARVVRGRIDRDAGRLHQADRWFASILEHSMPDLALAAVALGERARTAEARGDMLERDRFEARLEQLHADAEPAYLAWRDRQSWAPPADRAALTIE